MPTPTIERLVRERPDVSWEVAPLLPAQGHWSEDAYLYGADLVMEIVSPDDPRRDLVRKRREYAQARIPEYWIVYPARSTITVLSFADGKYAEYGIFKRGERATSLLLSGFEVQVDIVLDAV